MAVLNNMRIDPRIADFCHLDSMQADIVQTIFDHAGFVRTPIFEVFSSRPLLHCLITVLGLLAGKSSWQGAQTTVHAVLAPHGVNGRYYMDCIDCSGYPGLINCSVIWDRSCNDSRLAKDLYGQTVKYLKLM